MRLETRLEWGATEADVAEALHLPSDYVRNNVPTASQFVGPGPGQYEPKHLSEPTPPGPVLGSGPPRVVHFTPDHILPKDEYKAGRESELAGACPSVSPPRRPPRAKVRRKRGLVSKEVVIHERPLAQSASLPSLAKAFSFPHTKRPSNASIATPVDIGPASYKPKPTWKLGDMEPSRMIVGFQSSLPREPQWMVSSEKVTHEEIYRDRLKRQTLAAKSVLEQTVAAGPVEPNARKTEEEKREPAFDPFEWIKKQPDAAFKMSVIKAHLAAVMDGDGSNQFQRVQTPEYFRRASSDAAESTAVALALPEDDHRAPITCHFPNGLSLTYRMSVARSVRDLKVAVAKKLSARPTLETKHLALCGQDVLPDMLVLYFQGRALDDKISLADSGLSDRSDLIVAFNIKPRSSSA
ncbi:hypothetical protein ACHHYP_05369 [Achlya hypogyna]|uniref:Ubiquitin-like domain-containing protein n=1 Tax=Achlya hypogyna TaxID=1202772 RepID=A0A1V9YYK2_ACHHY|nr:hypothetical protein ACHHYP_05369 [Achlya hypogyna]